VKVGPQNVERVDPNSLGSTSTSGLRSSRATLLQTLALALAFALPLRAHDIYSSWTEAVLRGARLELTLTLARASALRLLPNGKTLPPITPENFAEYAAPLKAVAPDLFEIKSVGKELRLTFSEVTISGDADITFKLAYPQPGPGALRFAVSYLFQLVDGHVGTLVLTDSAGRDLGWSPVTVDQPVFEIRLPATSAAK
jgi:hypothetical protein